MGVVVFPVKLFVNLTVKAVSKQIKRFLARSVVIRVTLDLFRYRQKNNRLGYNVLPVV